MTSLRHSLFRLHPRKQEAAFAAMANGFPDTMPVPEPGKRIYAISFRHDGDVWYATVGEPMRGRRPSLERPQQDLKLTVPIEDSAIVVAIFAASRNNLCWVYHDGGLGSRRSNGPARSWLRNWAGGSLLRVRDGVPAQKVGHAFLLVAFIANCYWLMQMQSQLLKYFWEYFIKQCVCHV